MFGCFRIGCVRKSVETLDWSDCQFEELPNTIARYRLLEELLLRNNLLTTIPKTVLELKNIRVLDISDNRLYDIPREIMQLTNLVELNASRNKIDDLPSEIAMCKSLEILDLSNPVVEEDLVHTNIFPACLTNCISLRVLRMNKGHWKKLPDDIGNLGNLKILELRENDFDKLPESIGNLKDLEVLDIGYNMLEILSLPREIGGLDILIHLDASKNILLEVPIEIGDCTSLSILSLRQNNLTSLPMEIGKCSDLRIINIAENKLRNIPFTFQVLKNLIALWIGENQKQPLIKLQTTADEQNIKVLTCYLLPQEGHQSDVSDVSRINQNDFIGGPKVGFSGVNSTVDEDRTQAAKLERQDTPKPRNNRDRYRASMNEEKKAATSEVVTVKKTPDTSIGSCGSLVSLVHFNAASNPSLVSQTSIQQIAIKRDETGSLGLSFVSRADGSSIHENDSGIYISKIDSGKAAEEAGLKVGDKMIRNEEETSESEHTQAVTTTVSYPAPSIPIVLRSAEATSEPEMLSFASD